jgi:hypothetical protein
MQKSGCDSTDLFQSLGSTAPLAGDYHVYVSGPKCSDRPFSEELGDAEINTQIHRVLAHGVDMNPRAGPATLMEGIDSTRVTMFAHSPLVVYAI